MFDVQPRTVYHVLTMDGETFWLAESIPNSVGAKDSVAELKNIVFT